MSCASQPEHCASMRGAMLVRQSFMALRACRWLGNRAWRYCARQAGPKRSMRDASVITSPPSSRW